MNLIRRDVLRMGAGSIGLGLAGCLDSVGSTVDEGSDVPTTRTSFFVLYDIANQIAGDAASVESIVPFGQHGHGWEPSSSVVRDVLTSDAFIYVGPGFQPWADDIVTTIESDAPEVTVVVARHGIDLLDASDGANHDEEHNEVGHDEEEHHEDEGHEDEGDDHDYGNSDPHFWLDPNRTKHAVENVRDGLIKTDPDSEDEYRTVATEYVDELDALDERFQTELDDTERDVVLVAGHNAFGYLAKRYGFEVHALTGVEPDAEPSARAIREAQDAIKEHDIRHVLAPALESKKAAEQLVAETDAEAVLPITAIAGLTDEWQFNGWGYLDVMEQVNLSSLKMALGAK